MDKAEKPVVIFYDNLNVTKKAPLLETRDYEPPTYCPAGSFYRSSEATVTACGDMNAVFAVTEPASGTTMPSGEPWPENAVIAIPPGGEDDDGDTDWPGPRHDEEPEP